MISFDIFEEGVLSRLHSGGRKSVRFTTKRTYVRHWTTLDHPKVSNPPPERITELFVSHGKDEVIGSIPIKGSMKPRSL